MGLIDSFTGEVSKDTMESLAKSMHQKAFFARDQMKEGRKLFHEMLKEKEFQDKFVEAIKNHVSQDVGKDQKKALEHIDKIIDAIEMSLKDDVLIAHLMIGAIMELINKDKEIEAQGFPARDAELLVQKSTEELMKLKKALFGYSNILRQESSEGAN